MLFFTCHAMIWSFSSSSNLESPKLRSNLVPDRSTGSLPSLAATVTEGFHIYCDDKMLIIKFHRRFSQSSLTFAIGINHHHHHNFQLKFPIQIWVLQLFDKAQEAFARPSQGEHTFKFCYRTLSLSQVLHRCDQCGKSYSDGKALKAHIQSIHKRSQHQFEFLGVQDNLHKKWHSLVSDHWNVYA